MFWLINQTPRSIEGECIGLKVIHLVSSIQNILLVHIFNSGFVTNTTTSNLLKYKCLFLVLLKSFLSWTWLCTYNQSTVYLSGIELLGNPSDPIREVIVRFICKLSLFSLHYSFQYFKIMKLSLQMMVSRHVLMLMFSFLILSEHCLGSPHGHQTLHYTTDKLLPHILLFQVYKVSKLPDRSSENQN
jgi:hypothetical protein